MQVVRPGRWRRTLGGMRVERPRLVMKLMLATAHLLASIERRLRRGVVCGNVRGLETVTEGSWAWEC